MFTLIFADKRFKLNKADLLENKYQNTESIQYLSGNIEFQKDSLTLTCENAIHYEKKGYAILTDSVKVRKNEVRINCDTLYFNSVIDRISSSGKPHIWTENYSLISDSLVYFSKKDSGIAIGNAQLSQNNQIIKADRLEYFKNKGTETFSYIAAGNVVIEDSISVSKAGKAYHNQKSEKTILEDGPSINNENNTITGEKIFLNHKNNELSEIYIPKNPKTINEISAYRNINSDSTTSDKSFFKNSMEGSSLVGFFRNQILDSLRIEGMAKTTYHVINDSLYQGVNYNSGDTIIVSFNENEIKDLFIFGGSEGTYFPDSLNKKDESPISYSSNNIHYIIESKKTKLLGDSKIQHEETDLSAGFISINWNTRILNALPKLSQDTISKPQSPIILESGKDPMTGEEMTYNIDTKRGNIKRGSTKADDGYYSGKKIRNQDEKTIYIKNSIFTTCDSQIPHFHFESNKMKIIQDDVVIAKPIILYLGQIPVAGIPLGIFPHKGGSRHSGWLMPAYGESKSRGQFLDGLGYYWAPNPYWGSKLTTSFGDKQGVVLKLLSQYRLRYKFSGNIYFRNQQFLSNSDDISTLSKSRKSNILVRWNHSQILRKNQNFNANVTYSSNGDYNRNYGLDLAQRMDQKAISNITYSKRWPKSKNSISLNLYLNKDLLVNQKVNPSSNYFVQPSREGTQLNITNSTLPKFSFRHGQSQLFKSSLIQKKWYNNIKWDYGLNYTNKQRSYYESDFNNLLGTYDWRKDDDGNLKDTTIFEDGWIHTASLNSPSKIFKYISINPSIKLKSAWVNKTYDNVFDDSSQTYIKKENHNFAARTIAAFSINGNTKIYGLLTMPFGPLKVIRHVASPTIGFSWTPDYSKPILGYNLGYTENYTDQYNSIKIHDKFAGTMAGSTPKSEQKTVSFSLNNIFQAKIDRNQEQKKIDILSWRMSTNYNYAAEQYKLSNLRSTIRSKLSKNIRFDISMTHDFYDYDDESSSRSKILKKNKNGLLSPRLISARLSTGFRFSGNSWNNNLDLKEEDSIDTINQNNDLLDLGLKDPIKNINKNNQSGKLWSTNLNINYSINASNPNNLIKVFWANTSTTIQATKNWKISHMARFNVLDKNLISQSISVYRGLHCWELSLNWTPGGYGQGVYLKINVKSPTLNDLKFEKKGGKFSKSPF